MVIISGVPIFRIFTVHLDYRQYFLRLLNILEVKLLNLLRAKSENTVDSRYLEIEGTLKVSSRYPYFDISDL